MQFESGSELERVRPPKQRPELRPWAQAWSEAWFNSWPWAKRVAMEVEDYVQQFGQPWGEVWTQAEAAALAARALSQARAGMRRRMEADGEAAMHKLVGRNGMLTWKEIKARVAHCEGNANKMEALARPEPDETGADADALALACAWGWARREAQAQDEIMPSALADLSKIADILSNLNRYGVAFDLWHRSHGTRDEYSSITQFIAPITRLPLELLHEIFLIFIDEDSGPPSTLMLVCKHWHVIVTSI